MNDRYVEKLKDLGPFICQQRTAMQSQGGCFSALSKNADIWHSKSKHKPELHCYFLQLQWHLLQSRIEWPHLMNLMNQGRVLSDIWYTSLK